MHPTPQPYSPPAPPPQPIRPVRAMATIAVVALICDSVIGIVAVAIDLWYASLVDRMVADLGSVTDAEIDRGDLVYGLYGILEMAVYIGACVAFLVWLFRVRANAEVLAPGQHRRKRPWLILGWIVPIVSLWFPKQIVDDIWSASSRVPRPSHALLHAWWAAWLIGTWAVEATSRLLFRADDLPTLADAARFDAVANLLMLVAAALAIAVIRKITTAQQEHLQAPVGSGFGPGFGSAPGWTPPLGSGVE